MSECLVCVLVTFAALTVVYVPALLSFSEGFHSPSSVKKAKRCAHVLVRVVLNDVAHQKALE